MITPEEFLRKHDMFYAQMPLEELVERYMSEMDAGLRGEKSSLYMLPSYIPVGTEPLRGESVLVLDAGGTNFRAGRVHFDLQGRPAVERLKKRRMPGTEGGLDADAMFREMASIALDCAGECRYACISFSYPCRILPDGDGEILALCKELDVSGAEGRLVCSSLEKALRDLGAAGERRWRLINDSVGSLLGCMAGTDRSAYTDFIGFILGTGTNTCCSFPAAWITKDPAAAAMGGEMIVNLESGCFDRLLLGTTDRELDAASELPGDHLAEKMISGSYYRQVLVKTLELAVREGALPEYVRENLDKTTIFSAHVDAFCREPHGDNLLARALETEENQRFAAQVNDALLERASRVAASCLCAVLRMQALPRGSRVGICTDGTMLRLNPVLLPKMKRILESCAGEALGVETEFLFAEDATLLGCAWAGLIE